MKRTKSRWFKCKYITIAIVLAVIVIFTVDYIRISKYETFPRKPTKKLNTMESKIYYNLVNSDKEVDWTNLDNTLEYITNEYDCSDFRLVNLIRIIYEYGDEIPKEYMSKIENTLFNFRYWWDEPGGNSMCYWSENHQILFASAEYLIGQKFPDTIFPNSGLSGKQHMEKARTRALDWLEMRWKYGFIEFFSEVYYKEDIGAMVNLINLANDEELVNKTRIILDLLFYDVAAQNIKTMLVSTTGRAYEWSRKGGRNVTLGGITNYFWGDGKELNDGITYGLVHTQKYELPPIIKDIALDTSNVIIKQSSGLDLSDLKREGYYGTDNRSMMMQWGMESFTNPEIIRNTLKHMRNTNMFTNEFIGDFKMLDFSLIKWFHLEPTVSRIIKPQADGVAIQKGNTYTYKTPDYTLYTAQSYHPGTYGDQQHVFGMNIKNNFSIFHNHPALEKDIKHQSPNYWVGYGHLPHSVQDRNVNLSIYNIPDKKGLMELDLLDYTHAYFPVAKFDTAYISGRYLFGKKGNTYCAMIGANDFELRDDAHDDIIQKGKRIFWITEAGSKNEDGSFDAFVKRIQNNRVSFDPESLQLEYVSKSQNYKLKFGSNFLLNGKIVDTNYRRYDSPYVKADKKSKTLTFQFNGKSLFLDFEKNERIIN